MIIICGCDNNSAPSTATTAPTGPESFTTERPADSTATPKPQNPAQEIYMVPEYIKYDEGDGIVKYVYKKDRVIGYNENNEEVVILEFNSNGNIKKKTEYYNTNSSYISGAVYEYSDTGLLETVTKYFAGLGFSKCYSYNEAGMEIFVETKNSNADISVFDYSYSGEPRKQTATYKNGSKTVYTYNYDGQISREKYYDSMLRNGNLAYEVEYLYNDYGKISSTVKKYYNSTGSYVTKTVTEKYDNEGNLTVSECNENNVKSKKYYFYDDKANEVMDVSVAQNYYVKKYNLNGVEFGGIVDFESKPGVDFNFSVVFENGGYYLYLKDTLNSSMPYFLGVKKNVSSEGGINTESFYNSDGKIVNKYILAYDKAGRVVTEKFFSVKDNTEVCISGYDVTYDNRGNIINVKDYCEDFHTTYSFDNKGKISSILCFENNIVKDSIVLLYENEMLYSLISKTESSEIIMTFDEKGSITSTNVKNNMSEYVYDSNNVLSKKIFVDDNSVIHTVLYSYQNGFKMNYIEYINDNEILHTVDFTYTDKMVNNGWELKDATGTQVFKYNENTLIQSEAEYDSNGMLLSLTTYDANCSKVKAVFKVTDKETYDIYQKCNIFDLIPKRR